MPKINVYLPEGLAEAVKEAGIPVSAVCQHALELAVRRMAAVREVVAGGLDAAAADRDSPLVPLTLRAHSILEDAQQRARAEGVDAIQTQHVLSAILAEGGNLALRVLSTLDITPNQLKRQLDHLDRRDQGARDRTGSAPAEPAEPAEPADAGGQSAAAPDSAGPPFGPHSAAALELAACEATGLRTNYIGTEHLLLGLIAEPDGGAGQALRALGAELRVTRRAVAAALAGYYHHHDGRSGDQQSGSGSLAELVTAEVGRQLAPVLARLDSLGWPATGSA
jgi:ATP-dependent Clp protease ATP-binding subunit ClpA